MASAASGATRRGALCVALALLLGSCATTLPDFPERSPLGPLAPGDGPATAVSSERLGRPYRDAASRRELADRVADLIERRFYDPFLNGVDWGQRRAELVARIEAADSDQALYVALKELASAVHDSHTLVLTPREAADAREFVSTRTGAQLGVVGDRVAIVGVETGSPAQRAGVHPGDLVLAIDGHPLDASFFAAPPAYDPNDVRPRPPDLDDGRQWDRLRAVAALLRRLPDAPPAPHRLTVAGADGDDHPVVLMAEARPKAPRVASGRFDDGIAWLRIDRFQPQLRGEIVRALDAAATAPAVILDLRGNGGGSFDLYRLVAGRMMPERHLALYLLRRRGIGAKQTTVGELRLGGGAGTLAQPLAILIDSRTASAAELTAVTLAEDRGAILVGESSCGCAVGVQTEFVLPDGGALRIAEIGFRSPRGRRIEGEPILPPMHVEPTLEDLRTGRDAVVEAALRALRTKLGTGPIAALSGDKIP